MKRLYSTTAPLFLIFFIAFATNIQAQFWKGVKGNGNVQTETRTVSSFNKISASSGIDVIYTKGNQYVKVVADENLLELMVTEVKGKELIIKRKNNTNIKRSKKFEVHVSAPELTAVSVSSGADFVGKDEITTKQFNVSCSSGADVKLSVDANKVVITTSSGADANLEVQAESISAKASSGADIQLKGSGKDASLKASSGADINAFHLSVDNCEATASSSGDISIMVSESLNAKASSGGDISYKGNPANVDKSTSSGGDVTKK